ncbi:MAG TPA: DUF3048 domain-containing protein [Streptosporangiaceae bacterium]|nr:DUF3048 domain-containing protein [Streptosporangiaceae bacterium]
MACRTGEALLGELDRRVRVTFGIPQAAATALAVIDGADVPLTPSQVSDWVLTASATMTATLDLAVALAIVLPGGGTPAKPARAGSPALLSPFTGERVSALGPVLAVKIDNLAPARPQTGLTKADIVYVLPVEGGLSRILAVFSSHFPPVIGPVRSAREDDLELLAQFGRPAFAYSGAQPKLLHVVEKARIVDLYVSPSR